jgi:hypothetical protein
MCRLMPAALLKGFEAPVRDGLPAHTVYNVSDNLAYGNVLENRFNCADNRA